MTRSSAARQNVRRRPKAKTMAKAALPKQARTVTPEQARTRGLSDRAAHIRRIASERHDQRNPVEMIGLSPAFCALLEKLEKVARYREPVLITGESGVGKEHFAEAIRLLGCPSGPFVSVNCPQYQDGNVTVSELFGHKKGSFTGAVADHRGAFEQANGGVIFLDEIGDLPSAAQAMLLRALSTGDFRPLGTTQPRSSEARVVSATNRQLNQMVMSGDFRYDLFFRLRHFHLQIPPLRERGDDWRLLVDYFLAKLEALYGVPKTFSPESMALIEGYEWPGNVRQLASVVSTGYAMADDDVITPGDIESLLEGADDLTDAITRRYDRVVNGTEDFWKTVAQAFLNRDFNRAQLRTFVKKGLAESQGSYRRLLETLRLPATDYQKLMDFLRHHDLKP
jgi:DNA-binding NtrC family response regulator